MKHHIRFITQPSCTVTLSRWECDKLFPTIQYHRQIAEYLGYDPFKKGPPEVPKPPDATNP
jgi:hypothetical protein